MFKKKYSTLALESPSENLLLIRLNRPEVANAINTQLGLELEEVFSNLSRSGSEFGFRCIVLSGSGDRHFCAGGDLKERYGMTDEQFLAQHQIFERMILALQDCPIPVVAAVNGPAYAGGCELVLACDFVYASREARFALTEASLGIMPGCGGTQNLPRAVGMRRAKELILSARPFSAEEAYEWGLVNKLCEHGQVLHDALATASTICANAPLSLRQVKRAMDHGQRMDSRTAMFFEVEAYNRLVTTADRREGIAAFNEKRKPDFKGA
jgi:enoyl-CoA hydratase